jgi:hypothetical protein
MPLSNAFGSSRNPPIEGAKRRLTDVAERSLVRNTPARVAALVAKAEATLVVGDFGSVSEESLASAESKIEKSAALTNERDNRHLDDFGKDGQIRKADDADAFEVIWIDQFQANETFGVSAQGLKTYCAQLNEPAPTEVELQEVQKTLPLPAAFADSFQWTVAAYRLIEKRRKEERIFKWDVDGRGKPVTAPTPERR